MQSPCNWELSYPAGVNGSALANLPAEEKARVESMASDFLWNWTGQQFGECEATIRPCRRPLSPDSLHSGDRFTDGMVEPKGTAGWWPVMLGGNWYNIRCGSHDGACGCSVFESIHLPHSVTSVTEIRIAGEVLASSAYVVDGHALVRTDGDPWPVVLTVYGPESSAFELDVVYGTPIPEGGKVAAGLLAIELAKAIRGDNGCQLPRRLQTLTREGVTVGLMDTFEDIGKGHTGIWLVDSWVASIMSSPRASAVYSPDVPRRRYRRVD